jgi:hypothetical protein
MDDLICLLVIIMLAWMVELNAVEVAAVGPPCDLTNSGGARSDAV